MKCEKFEQRLNEQLDERRCWDDDPQLAEHAARCAGCRELLSLYDTLFDGLDARSTPEPDDRFALGVLEKMSERPHRARSLLQIVLPLAIAAAVLVALRPMLNSSESPSGAPNDQIVETAPGTAGVPEIALYDPTSEQYLTVIRLTGRAMATLPNTVRRATDDSPMVEGIRPLTYSFSAALDALRRTLPSKPSASPGVETSSSSSLWIEEPLELLA